MFLLEVKVWTCNWSSKYCSFVKMTLSGCFYQSVMMKFCHVSFVHFQGSKNKEVFNTEELIQVSFPNQSEK